MSNSKISSLTASVTPLTGSEVLPIVQSSITKQVSVANLTDGRDVSSQSLTTSKNSSTGYVALNLVNTSQANVSTKVIAQLFTGFDTVGTRKDVFSIQYEPADSNNVNGNTVIRNRVGDTLAVVARYNGADYKIETGNLVQGTAAKGINFTANTPAAGMTSQLLNWYEEGTWTPNDSSGAGLSLAITGARYTRIGRQVTCTAFLTYPVTASAAAAVIGGLPFSAGGEGGFGVTGYSAAGFQLFLRSNSATSIAFVNNANVVTTNVALSTALIGFSFVYFV